MAVVGFKAQKGKGKTISMIATAIEYVVNGGYTWSECIGNVSLRVKDDGYTYMDNSEIRRYVSDMYKNNVRHKILLLDEIDSVFPARFFKNDDQTGALVGLWQDEKAFHKILYTTHLGKSTDKIIRDSTQILIIPNFDRELDMVQLKVINGDELKVGYKYIHNISRFYWIYNRWDFIL